jgi:hypothetical protein
LASKAFITGQTLDQLRTSFQVRKFRVIADIRNIQAMLEFLLSQNNPKEPGTSERIEILQQQLATRTPHLQLLEKLVITATRFSEVEDAEEALLALGEILGALLGCESYALFQFDKAGQELRIISSQGIADAELRSLSAAPRVWELLEANASADVFTGGEGVAMIPVRVRDRVLGMLILYKLLPQRWQLEDEDHELLRTIGIAIGESISKFACPQETSPNAI